MSNPKNINIKHLGFLTPVILMSIFPILSFYLNNISELSFKFLEKPILYSVVASLIIATFFYLITKSKQKTILISTTLLFIFFSYGHFSKFLNDKLFIRLPNGVVLGPDKILLPMLFICFPIFLVKAIKTKRDLTKLIATLTISLSVVVAYLLLNISYTEYKRGMLGNLATENDANRQASGDTSTPDVYFIILDGYARQDVLKEIYNYDNSEFIKDLQKMGFYVADQAKSNYIQTFLSLPSTLNIRYLDDLPKNYGVEPDDKFAALSLLQSNDVTKKFKNFGYKTINFASGWEGTDENYVADINYNEKKILKISGVELVTNETNMIFLQTTILSPFIKEVWGDVLRGKMLSIFEKLPDIPFMQGQKFILAHILAPHPPYVFQANGSAVKNPKLDMMGDVFEDKNGYIEQLTFVSNQIIPVLQKIIDNSKTPPIIILQSDHGPASVLGHPFNWKEPYDSAGVNERAGILYAIYLPDKSYEEFYPTITPVNTFRIILSRYFGENLDLLPDKTYFSNYDKIYDFVDVTEIYSPD